MTGKRKLLDEMRINPARVSEIIERFLREKVAEKKRDGIVLGLSGGLDSAVVSTLAVRGIGAEKVHALHLFDRDSEKKFLNRAQSIARKLGIHFTARDITPLVKEKAIYTPLMMRFTAHSPCLNRLIVASLRFAYLLLCRENPFNLILKQAKPLRGRFAPTIYETVAGSIERSFVVRHFERRRLLEEYAAERNLLLVGAANKSEFFVGWFVKDGVDDLPVEPLLGLYKTQLRQLAQFVNVPPDVIQEAPSPDMLRGVTDEFLIGFAYETLDKVFYVLEHELGKDIAVDAGIRPREFEAIKTLKQLSAWKRENPHEYPVLD